MARIVRTSCDRVIAAPSILRPKSERSVNGGPNFRSPGTVVQAGGRSAASARELSTAASNGTARASAPPDTIAATRRS